TGGSVAALCRCESRLRAGLGRGAAGQRILSRKRQHASGHALRRPRQLAVLWRLEPLVRRPDTRVSLRLVREEAKQPVPQNRAADAAALLVEAVGVAPYRARIPGSVPLLKRIQVRPVRFEKQAAAEVIRAVFENDLDCRPCSAAFLGAVVARDDADFFDAPRTWRQPRRSTPRDAVHTDTVDLNQVRVRAGAVRRHLRSVLDEEDAVGGAGRRSV